MSKKVSDLFIDIYQNFNVTNQSERMLMLSRKELILLLILTIDDFSVKNEIVMSNYTDEELVLLIYKMADEQEVNDPDILDLVSEFGSYINVNDLRDKNDNPLPNALSEEEATIKRREIHINKILK